MVEMICTGGPFWDCCYDYNVLLNHEYTVRDYAIFYKRVKMEARRK